MFDNFVSALSDRFRQQYPQGSIISDLVQIHGDQYVVKVSISVENTLLVSTLAVDANLMLAENRAIERALTILGIRDLQQSVHESVNLRVKPLPDLPIGLDNFAQKPEVAIAATMASAPLPNGGNLPAPVINFAEVVESPILIEETALPPAFDAPKPISIQVEVASDIVQPSMQLDPEPSVFEPDAEIAISTMNGKIAPDSAPPEILATLPELTTETVPEMEVLAKKSSRTKKAATAPDALPAVTTNEMPLTEAPWDEISAEATVPIAAEQPLSVTDMIPMINMELKRLGWSKDRGREYMVSLYNKRASALLSDDELFGLLQHLQAEPVV